MTMRTVHNIVTSRIRLFVLNHVCFTSGCTNTTVYVSKTKACSVFRHYKAVTGL